MLVPVITWRRPPGWAARLTAAGMVLLGLIATTGGSAAPWCTIMVSSCESLRDAVESLPPASTICLEPGTYVADLAIRTDLTLRGSGGPHQVVLVGRGEEDEPAIEFAADYRSVLRVFLENLTVTGAVGEEGKPGRRSGHGLLIGPDIHVLLRNGECSESDGAGLYLEEEASAVAYECEFGENRFGAFFDTAAGGRFDECGFPTNEVVIGLGKDCQLLLTRWRIEDNTEIGVLIGESPAMLYDCELIGNGWGILLASTNDASARLRTTRCAVKGSRNIGMALLTAECYSPEVPEVASALISGGWNEIPGPDEENGNAGGALLGISGRSVARGLRQEAVGVETASPRLRDVAGKLTHGPRRWRDDRS